MYSRTKLVPCTILITTVFLIIVPFSLNSFVSGQVNLTSTGQQTSITRGEGEVPTINYIINPPPNPTVQQPPPPLVVVQGANMTDPNSQEDLEITDQWVLAIAFVGAAAGVIYRTLYPYFERLHEMEVRGEPPVKFLRKYKFTFGISLLISVVTTMGMFSTLIPQLDTSAGLGLIFISSFVQGIGWNELTNRVSYKIADKAVDLGAAKKRQPPLTDSSLGTADTDKEKRMENGAPKIIGRYPLPDQKEVSVNSPIAVTFNKPIDALTVTKDNFTLRMDNSDISIEAKEIRPEENLQTIIFKPQESLQKNAKYIFTVSGEVKDHAGNNMLADETWSFVTSEL